MTMTKADDKAIAKPREFNIADAVADKVRSLLQSRQIDLPADYSAENAIKAAWIQIQQTEDKGHNRALDVCTKESIAQALLDMLLQGLNPTKRQCYWIVYGKRLVMMRSYFGTAAIAMQHTGCNMPRADVIYEGDEFEYEITADGKRFKRHLQKLENIGKAIKAAYCQITWPAGPDGQPARGEVLEIMTFEQIQKAWRHSQTWRPEKPDDPHQEQPEEFAKRTILNRACKMLINSSSDSALFQESFNRLGDEEAALREIDAGANTGEALEIELTGDQGPEREQALEAGEAQADAIAAKAAEPRQDGKRKAPFA